MPQRLLLPMMAGLVILAGCNAADPAAPMANATAAKAGCLPAASGFLRARLRGAIDVDLDWRDAQMQCEGGTRPDGEGIRVSIAGPLPAAAGAMAGRTLRFVFGIDTPAGAQAGSALATNVTVIVEGGAAGPESAIYATRGGDKCTTDRLGRAALEPASQARIDARGFCVGPATRLNGDERLLVTTFDFAGRVSAELP